MKKAFLISPSGIGDKKNLNFAKKRLADLGFEAFYRQDILSKHLSYAGDFKRRAKEINEAYSSDAEIIFAMIGGMGAIHILPYINYKKIKKSKKILVGLSDVTILLNSIYQKTDARCLHGPNIGKTHLFDKKTKDCLIDVINKKNYKVIFQEKDVFHQGKTEAQIVGGNVELLGRSLGTKFEVCTKGKIIFLEDYDMKSWRIFDILWQLKLAGKFRDIKGIILGYFVDCGKDINLYLKEFFKDFRCPILINQPIGHSEPNLTIPLGEKCVIDTEKKFWGIYFRK